MNQILYTGGKNKRSAMSEKTKIVIIFVVIIIAFGICLTVLGTNLLNKVKNENVSNTTPGDNPNNQTANPDVKSNINVEFGSELGAVKVKVTSNVAMKSVEYWWDELETQSPTTVEVSDTQYEVVVPSKQGTHTLNVKVTDENGYEKIVEQVVIGVADPDVPGAVVTEVTILTDGVSNYVVRVKDDEEIDKVVIVLNGETKEIEVNSKEFEHKIAIPQGNSLISVTAYNLNGISTNKKAKITNFGG